MNSTLRRKLKIYKCLKKMAVNFSLTESNTAVKEFRGPSSLKLIALPPQYKSSSSWLKIGAPAPVIMPTF